MPLPQGPQGTDIYDYFEAYTSPYQDARSALLSAIAEAQASIVVGDYGMTMPDLVDLLIQKARTGVRVRVLLDHSQSAGTTEHPLVQRLRDAATITPLLTVVITTSPVKHAIMHLKVAVIDGLVVIGGSYNYSGKDAQSGAQAEVNQLLIIPSARYAQEMIGRITVLSDWALTREPQYQAIGPDASVGARPPEGGDVAPTPRSS